MRFPRPREVLSPRAFTQILDMITIPSTVKELGVVTFTDAQRKEKESPTPMSAQRAYSRAAESIALDLRDAYLSTSPVNSKRRKGKKERIQCHLFLIAHHLHVDILTIDPSSPSWIKAVKLMPYAKMLRGEMPTSST